MATNLQASSDELGLQLHLAPIFGRWHQANDPPTPTTGPTQPITTDLSPSLSLNPDPKEKVERERQRF